MKFPYPENSEDWQTAYTRDHAYQDSKMHKFIFWAPIYFSFFIVAVYISLHIWPFSFPESYSAATQGLIIFSFFLLSFLSFALILNIFSLHFASSFLTELHHLPEGVDPSKIIKYRLSGKPKLPPPLNLLSQFEYIIIKDGEIDKKNGWAAWSACNLGGPFILVVFDGCALYLERGNRFSRVVGPGEEVPFLEWYETIKYVVDLRPKVKTDKFEVWTKDGIKLQLTVQVESRIGDPTKNDPANGIVYPYDPVAVKKAIERYSLRWGNRLKEEPSEFTWLDAAWGQVTGIVPGYIGGRMLDDLFMADRDGGQILSPNAIKEIFGKLNQATNGFGVFITDFQILKVEIPEEVYEHQKEHWMAERQGDSTKIDGQAKAFSIRAHEKTRADTQRDLILAIAEGLGKNKDGQFTEPLLLSLSGILDESLMTDPLLRAYLARETLEALEQLQKQLEHPLNHGEALKGSSQVKKKLDLESNDMEENNGI